MTDFKGQREKQQEVALTIPVQGTCNPSSMEEGQLPYPTLAPVVCFGLKQTTRLRNWCLKMTCGPWLDYASILVVLINCVTLGMYEPCEETSSNIEMLALGVYDYEGSYLSNNWNKFDVLIISGEVLNYFLTSLGIHIQICHALRPMRLIGRVQSLRDLVIILLDTVPMLGNVLILYIFVIHIFGVVGVQLWAGQLLNRCFLGEDIPKKYNVSLSPYFASKYGEKGPFICSSDGKYGMRRCRDVPPYSQDGETCSLTVNEAVPAAAGIRVNGCVNWNLYYNVCRAGDQNPDMGAINFDNIGYALIAIFQVVTLEGWREIMFYVMDAHSFWSLVFFVLVTIMGSFIMMNVCAVVIATQFSENLGRETGKQPAGAITQLCNKLTSWLWRILQRYKRYRDKVHPSDSESRSTAIMGQAWMSFKRKLATIVKSKLFDRVIMFAVFLSILTIAVEHHKQPVELTRMLQISNIIFTFIFVVEMALKQLALAWAYFRDRNNIFDFIIVIISLWEIIAKADGRLSVLRAFRLLRFVRLVHFLPYLKRQLLVLKRTMEEAGSLCMLLLFVIFVFSVMGMHLFGCTFSFQAQKGHEIADRMNFDSILWSMVTVFQILTQEDWNLVLYNAMAATTPWAAFYFVTVIVLGKHVILNVLVGIVVESFQARRSSSSDDDSTSSTPTSLTPECHSSVTDSSKTNGFSRCILSCFGSRSSIVTNSTDNKEDNRSLNITQRVLRWCRLHEDWSFYVLSPQNKFRIFCQRVIFHKLFDHVVLLFILLSCVTIAMERPGIHPKSKERWILDMSRYVFSAVFLVEMLFKVLALGLAIGKDTYCRSSWNVMDGSLVILSLVHIFVSLASTGKDNWMGILKVLRLLRTLRPLRVIKRAPKLKLAVEALIASVKPIGNIVLICCAFFFFFGILGVQLFKGKFYYCVGQVITNITSKTDCLSANNRWVRKEYNFDNLPQALMALFVMYSKDGWVNIMYDGLDAVGVDKPPVRNHNEWMLLFFISFMIMSFFLLDMFIGVMVETFHQCQQEQKRGDEGAEGGGVLQHHGGEPEQPYYTNYSPIRRAIHTLCTSNFLDLFMSVIIFISVLMMAFEHYNQPPYIEKLTEYSYYMFTAILIIEVLLKLVAFGIMRFLKISWNLLDVFVVFVSIISIVFNEMKMADAIPINPSILRVCRVLRLAQVLKAKKIRVLLKTIIKTLSQVGNICLLFMFFFFIYAALGVELFGKLECTDDHPCLGLHRHSNFRHFGMALLTLYQVCTGDNWSGIMKDTLRECRPDGKGCLRYLSWVSPIYFTSFVIMAQFVLINLVVAAIMQALEDSNENKSIAFCLPLEDKDVHDTELDPACAGESVKPS
ncbi:voltage-dependent T-type calcium channel subunit alpha-1H isoform X2 [Lates calcarifer]|uniref:Voltage-dependent T-type calcium channel subunit alpha-1H isoform X2 n=1 Tax=Lates calcarifer TaxID=8187 RepID=A0AAJ8BKP8_LATCA|nr:voltage-dependent T-type calcium channel subunit alpha-1H isoform X2 [Lates calcarifer]